MLEIKPLNFFEFYYAKVFLYLIKTKTQVINRFRIKEKLMRKQFKFLIKRYSLLLANLTKTNTTYVH